MEQALSLAVRGRGEVEPNPRVGAIALQDGEVVGRGWHRLWGGPHAEVEALGDAREQGAKPDTLVVTLEPCSTPQTDLNKKTPPCTEAILAAGIERVIVGMTDPDPRHRGKGIAALRGAGIEITEGVLASRCEEINRPFTRWLSLDRPWTIAKYAMTLDGKTAAPSGEARWISGTESRARVHELRSRVNAVLVGFRTAKLDDPQLTVRHAQGPQPIRIVVDPLAEIPQDGHLVTTASETPTWLLVNADVEPGRIGRLRDLGVTVIQVESADTEFHPDLSEAWRELRRRGIRRLLVEGGGKLLAQLLSQDCVDQILAFVAPKIMGGESSPTPVAGAGQPSMDQAWRLGEMYSFPCGDDLAIGAFVNRH
jgi:diaminohydroxyphosphoribosylaminopyrimidine deaminase/5-amino-6-(5-phosphoribosylamino)uracil reductase